MVIYALFQVRRLVEQQRCQQDVVGAEVPRLRAAPVQPEPAGVDPGAHGPRHQAREAKQDVAAERVDRPLADNADLTQVGLYKIPYWGEGGYQNHVDFTY